MDDGGSSCKGGLIFKDIRVLILPTLLGKKRLSLFESQIVKGGGIVCSPNQVRSGEVLPTYIVVEDSLLKDHINLRKQLKNFTCLGIIVGTRWLSECLKQKKLLLTEDYQMNFHTNEVSDFSLIETPGPSLSKRPKLSKEMTSGHDVPKESQLSPRKAAGENYICSHNSLTMNEAAGGNQVILQELQKLADAFRNKGDSWRAHGYAKAISAIRQCGKVLSSYEDAVALPGVGDRIASKIWEIIETGSSRKVSEICGDEKTKVLELFTNIWGVGPSTADAWYQQGYRTLDDVKDKGTLNKQQLIGLKHFSDFLERIPREEVEEVGQIVTAAANSIEPALSVHLVGSYRRGKSSCGDIDLMVTKPDHFNSKDVLSQLLTSLKVAGLVTDDLVSMEKEGNQCKYLGVCCLPGQNRKHRRLDIFIVPSSEFATALMHYTGSALFNRSIRLLASKKGMSLSEHSLLGGIVRQGSRVLNDGFRVPTPSEESIFNALELEYRPPEERDH